MRKTIMYCLFLLTFLVSYAQSYRPIPSIGAQFRMEYQIYYSDPFSPQYYCSTAYHQFTAGDTIIDSLTVIKVRTGPKVVCASFGLGGPNTPLVYEGYLWQDSLLGKVYYKEPGSAPELLFDFTANPGDVIPLPSGLDIYFSSPTFRVDSVDTVTYGDGIPRRRLYLTENMFGGNEMHIWVEGIGNINYGLLPIPLFEDECYATCYKEFELHLADGANPFCASPASCDLLLNQASPEPEELVQLKSNPGKILHLDGIKQPMEVVVYSLQGQIVAQTLVSGDGQVKETEQLSEGLYLVRLQPIGGGGALILRWVKE